MPAPKKKRTQGPIKTPDALPCGCIARVPAVTIRQDGARICTHGKAWMIGWTPAPESLTTPAVGV